MMLKGITFNITNLQIVIFYLAPLSSGIASVTVFQKG
jgi:hypothetical protein